MNKNTHIRPILTDFETPKITFHGSKIQNFQKFRKIIDILEKNL